MTDGRPPDPGGGTQNLSTSFKPNFHKNSNDSSVDSQKHKRMRPNSPETNDSMPKPKLNTTFLLVTRPNGESLSKVSPFLIEKLLSQACGSVKNAKKLRDGSLLVESHSTEQAEKLIRNLPDNRTLPLTVNPHPTLNCVKGVIYCPDLDEVPIDEVKQCLRNECVTDIVRMMRRVDGQLRPTNNYIVTLGLASLPSRLKIGYYSVPLRPYIPLPIKCRQCHRFNHLQKDCKSPALCPDCGDIAHMGQCEKPLNCLNCKASHSSIDKNCPQWIQQKRIMEVKTVERISYSEAKRKVVITQNILPKSFSAVLNSNTQVSINKPEPKKVQTTEQAIQCNISQDQVASQAPVQGFLKIEPKLIQSNSNPRENNKKSHSKDNKKTPSKTLEGKKPVQSKAPVEISTQAEIAMMMANDWDEITVDEEFSSTNVSGTVVPIGQGQRKKGKKKQ